MPKLNHFFKGALPYFFAFNLIFITTLIYGQSSINRLEEFKAPPGIDLNTVYCFHLDNEGFLWFGTGNGLIRYDGANYKNFQPDPLDEKSIGGPAITCLESYGDSLLIGFKGYGFDIYDKSNDVFYHFTGDDSVGMINDYVEAIKVDEKNNIWVGFEQITSVFKFDITKKVFEPLKLTKTLSRGGINEILHYDDSFLLIGTYGEGLYSVNTNNNKLKYFNPDNSSLSSDIIFDLEFYNDSSIWVSSRNGLELIKFINNQLISSENFPLPHPNLSINRIKMDPGNNNHLWVGTREDGVYLLNIQDKIFQKIYSPFSRTKNSEYINALFFDNSKNLWVGTDNIGTFRKNTKAEQFNDWEDPNLFLNYIDGQSITCMLEDSNGKLWIGTKSDGLYYMDFEKELINRYNFDREKEIAIQKNEIRGIAESTKGEIWFGVSENGIYKIRLSDPYLKEEKIEIPFFGRGIVRDLKITKDNFLWIATKDYLIKYDPQNKKSRKYTTENGLSTNRVRHLYTGDEQKMWVGTDKGLNVIDLTTEKISYFLHNPLDETSLSNNLIRFIYRDKNSRLWVGSRGGLNLFLEKENKFMKFPDFSKKGITAFLGVAESKGNLWFCTNNGIIQLNPNLEDYFQYNLEDGLQSNSFEYNNYYQANSGRVYFGGSNGINAFFPDQIERNNHVPPVHVTSVKINNKTYDINQFKKSKNFTLNHDQKDISFQFSALDFTYPLRNQFLYKLENYDSLWNLKEGIDEAIYTNLDPGEYVFHVKGANNHGIWNEKPDQIYIYINPPWWSTWWFRLLTGIFVLALVIGFYYLRTYQLKSQKLVLENLVKKRTIELKEANEEIHAQNEELSQVNSELHAQGEELTVQNEELSTTLEQLKLAQAKLVQSEKLTSLGILTAGIAHEINNPVNFIKAGIVGLEKAINKLILLIREYDRLDKFDFDVRKNEIDQLKEKIQFEKLLVLIQKVSKDITLGTNRTAKIIKDLRTFSKTDNQELALGDLHESIDSCLVLLHNQYKNHIQIIKKYGSLPPVAANHSRLNQVFMNLLLNAIQSISGKGNIYLTTVYKDSEIKFSIKDTGHGIKKELKDHIFEPFYSTKDEGKGMGLGLSISLNIIKDHNGQILVESEVGKGTEFIIMLPVQSENKKSK